jgi:carboxylesterase type B
MLRPSFRALSVVLTMTIVSCIPLPPGSPVSVSFPGLGTVLGVKAADVNVQYWLGVPFAATTTGANRFMPPQPRAPWSTPLNGTVFAPGCLSPHHGADVPPVTSEDCLSLNIFTPIEPSPTPLPVMAFFNGGAYLEGSDQGPFGMYSGARLAAKFGVVVVTCAYRLGPFGWLALGDGSGVNGNFGLMDQVAALTWIRDHIGAVGGDPGSVTVFGESAGAMSIGILLTSQAASGLFHRAILESDVGGFNYHNLTQAAVYGASFCSDKALNCSTGAGGKCDLACIQNAPSNAVESAWGTATGSVPDFIFTDLGHILDGLLGTGPVIDGQYVTAEPIDLVQSGVYWGSTIPILLGTNSNEGETFIYDGIDFALPGFLVPLVYDGLFNFNTTISKLVDGKKEYNSAAFPDGRTPLSHVVTHMWFRCASEQFARGAGESPIRTPRTPNLAPLTSRPLSF